jgi:hypothetical protein
VFSRSRHLGDGITVCDRSRHRGVGLEATTREHHASHSPNGMELLRLWEDAGSVPATET